MGWGSQDTGRGIKTGRQIGSVNFFFDRQAVMKRMDAATAAVLSKFGAFVMTAARQSIRTRKDVSQPGAPPTNRVGTLKRFIFFVFDPALQSVVIGPESLGGDVPGILEFGGDERIDDHRVRERHVGDGGEVQIGPPECATSRIAKGTNLGDVLVTYTRIRTARQAARANMLNRMLYLKQAPVHVKPRPYMRPAFDRVLDELPAIWRDSVRITT
jgi:hypothetical protein